MNKKHKIFLYLSLVISLVSCNDFLDEIPDNRLELDSKEKIQALLTTAYSTRNFVSITEYSSDNVDDNKFPTTLRSLRELAYWQDVSGAGNDDPVSIWGDAYYAIAHSNQALDAINKIDGVNLSAEKGEALITRAYSHFNLVNIFAKHYSTKSSEKDLGIPYLSTPETTLNPKYTRESVADVYKKIDTDIKKGLPLINDNIYSVKSFHFNKSAAYAFAARFYLYYGKWDEAYKYASLTLNSGAKLRDWSNFGKIANKEEVQSNEYITSSSNLLVSASTSSTGRVFSNFGEGREISHTRKLANTQTLFAPLPWSPSGLASQDYLFQPKVYIANNYDKVLHYKIHRDFEILDPVANTGYAKTVLAPFTTDETLLVRAEALIMLGRYEEALSDINKWNKSFYSSFTADVTQENVNTFYNSMPYSVDTNITQKKKLNPSFIIRDNSHENMIHYILQCRRILTLHEGLRWFDIKRYGIEVTRYVNSPDGSIAKADLLTKDDLRRALQLPKDVISAGLTPNPR